MSPFQNTLQEPPAEEAEEEPQGEEGKATSPEEAQRSERTTSAPREAPRGPARLFYDRSKWTGVHRHGGPSTLEKDALDLRGKGAGKGGKGQRGVPGSAAGAPDSRGPGVRPAPNNSAARGAR